MLSGIFPSIWFLLKSRTFKEPNWEIWSGIVPQMRLLLRFKVSKELHWERCKGIGWLKRLSPRFKLQRLESSHTEDEISRRLQLLDNELQLPNSQLINRTTSNTICLNKTITAAVGDKAIAAWGRSEPTLREECWDLLAAAWLGRSEPIISK